MQAPPPTVLCFKCGQSGHWSRDCTLPPSEWQRRPAAAPAARPAPSPATAAPPVVRTSTQGTPAHRGGAPGGYARGPQSQKPGDGAVQQRPVGCWKCGKSGHWARDCDAPPDQQLPRSSFPSGNAESALAYPNLEAGKAAPAKKKPAKRPRKRKITVEDLKEKDAIAEVFYEFPKRFARKFRGKGHELSDLRRLLEMYVLWQQKHFPLHTFDEAMHQIADLGKSNRLKMELREMRQNVLKIMQNEPAAQQEDAAQQGAVNDVGAAAEAAAAEGAQEDGGPAAWEDDDDDDELVQLQHQQGWAAQSEAVPMDLLEGQFTHGAGSSAQAGGAQQTAGQRMDVDMEHGEEGEAVLSAEDEALLALAQETPLSQGGPALLPGSLTMAGTAEEQPLTDADMELLALAEEGHLLSQAEAGGAPAGLPPWEAAAAGQQAAAAGQPAALSAEDEKLLALAQAPMSQADGTYFQAGVAPSVGAVSAVTLSAEEEELLELAQAPMSQADGEQSQAGVAPTAGAVSAVVLCAEDEEPPALADAPMSQADGDPHQAGLPTAEAISAVALGAQDEELLALAQAPPSQLACVGGLPLQKAGADAEGGPCAPWAMAQEAAVAERGLIGSAHAGQAAAPAGVDLQQAPATELPADAKGHPSLAALREPASLLQGAPAEQGYAGTRDGPEMGQAAAQAPGDVGGHGDDDDDDEELLALL